MVAKENVAEERNEVLRERFSTAYETQQNVDDYRSFNLNKSKQESQRLILGSTGWINIFYLFIY